MQGFFEIIDVVPDEFLEKKSIELFVPPDDPKALRLPLGGLTPMRR